MADREKKFQKSVWILMHFTANGWVPSIDHGFPWSSRESARAKIRSLGELGKNYRAYRFDLRLDIPPENKRAPY